MIDIHTHILPNLDDGARDMREALAMARIAVDQGTTHMFATPHQQFQGTRSRQEIKDRVAALQKELDAANIELKILPGYEIRLEGSILEDWDNDLAGPLGDSRYVLVEPLFERYDQEAIQILDQIFLRGYIPIMAHPERIMTIQKDVSLLEPFIARGGLTQITSHSLTGYHGQKAKQVAREMLHAGWGHILASDSHHENRRQPVLSEGVVIAAEIVGQAKAEAMVTTTPWAIVNDEPITTELLFI